MKTLFSGGLVFDGDSPPVSGQDVLVENGRIEGVRPAGEFSGFDGTQIDTTGMTLMPGLIDCHVHLIFGGEQRGLLEIFHRASPSELALRALENAQATLRGGMTSARDLGDREFDSLIVRDAINAGRHLGPTLRCAGRCICITGGQGSWANGREVDSPAEAVKAVRENVKAGVDLIKFTATTNCTDDIMGDVTLPELSLEDLTAGVAAANARGRGAACHAQGTLGISNAVQAGISSIEHGFAFTDEAKAQMIQRGTYFVPTLSRFATAITNEDMPPFMVERVQRFRETHRESVIDFHRSGGLIAMGTDMGSPLLPHGENSQELRRLVEVGIDPLDALRIGTSRGADLLGLNDRGRVKEGYWADLLIVRGDPSEDIEAAADRDRHAYIFKNGFDVLATLGPPKSGAAYPRFAAV